MYSTSDLLPAILAITALTPISALLVFFVAKPLLAFRPTYRRCLLASGAGHLATLVVGIILISLGLFGDGALGIVRVVGGVLVMSCCHVWLLRGPNGESVTPGKAVTLTVIQGLGLVLAMGIVGLTFVLLFKK